MSSLASPPSGAAMAPRRPVMPQQRPRAAPLAPRRDPGRPCPLARPRPPARLGAAGAWRRAAAASGQALYEGPASARVPDRHGRHALAPTPRAGWGRRGVARGGRSRTGTEAGGAGGAAHAAIATVLPTAAGLRWDQVTSTAGHSWNRNGAADGGGAAMTHGLVFPASAAAIATVLPTAAGLRWPAPRPSLTQSAYIATVLPTAAGLRSRSRAGSAACPRHRNGAADGGGAAITSVQQCCIRRPRIATVLPTAAGLRSGDF